LFYAKKTGTTGGEIMHAEIRTDADATVNDTNSDDDYEKNSDDD